MADKNTNINQGATATHRRRAYWRANVRLLLILLAIWFSVSFGAGILLAGPLNNMNLGGYPLGFWFAQQGSIYVFVGLIFFYAHKMNELDRRYATTPPASAEHDDQHAETAR